MNNKIEIKCVKKQEELNYCFKIREEVFIKEKKVPVNLEHDEYDIINDVCDHFYVTLKNNVIGALRCLKIDEETVKIQRLCLLKKYRNKGFGKLILLEIEKHYKKENYHKLILHAKFSASNFYIKCGFLQVSPVFIEANIEHVKMEKNI